MKAKVSIIEKDKPKYNIEDIMIIYFQPTDNSFYEGIKCTKDDIFAEVEEKLYKKRNEFRNTNNTFTANALPVLRFKSLGENSIKDGNVITLFKSK